MNVVVIVLDTGRRDHLGCYGYHRNTSPNIDKLAEQGTLFTRCYATDVPTLPSYTALLSGRKGIVTGRVSFNPTEAPPFQGSFMPTDAPWLTEILGRNGYTTAAVSTLFHMGTYFPRGFQYYLNPMAGVRERTQTVNADEINAFALPWLAQHHKEKFFLFVHYWDPHVESVWGKPSPPERYVLPEGFKNPFYKGKPKDPTEREYIVSQYDANIAFADKHIGDLLKAIDDYGIADDTLVILTADHGENLGEDHPLGKAIWDHLDIHEPVVRIPLIIRHPGKAGVRRVEAMVQNVDIPATLLHFLGIPVPESYSGINLLPLVRGETKEGYPEVFTETGFLTCKRALITDDGWKLIKSIDNGPYKGAPTTELYNLNADPDEVNNLADVETERLNRLELRMLRWLEKNLGNRPDPLALRAHMGMVGPLVPFYGYIHVSRERGRIYTATPEEGR